MASGEDDFDKTMLRVRQKPEPAARPAAAPAPSPGPASTGGGAALSSANVLVEAASPLLLLAANVRDMVQPPNLDRLRIEATQGVRNFEESARARGAPNDLLLTARYLVCTVVDEAVLNTPGGDRTAWSAQSLLATFHHEAWGGEKFFQVMERAKREPRRYTDLLDLIYVCLSLGFVGKYQVENQGQAKLGDVRHELYRTLADVRGPAESELAPHWRGVEDKRNPVIRFVPLWVIAALVGVLWIGAFAWYYSRLSAQSGPVSSKLAQIGLGDLSAPQPLPPPPPPKEADKQVPAKQTLKTLLAGEEGAGHLQVNEYADRTIVTLPSNQFASASAQVNPQFTDTLKAVATAINTLGGRVMVQGHTDDQPLRSIKFSNNYELSANRARAVGDILRQTLVQSIGIETVGRGPDQPRCTPPDTPENRLCNRRVEIIHFPAN